MKNKAVLLSAMFAVLGVASGPAHAVPIVFEFTGTAGHTDTIDFFNLTSYWDTSLLGQEVTGRIIMETDGLNQFASSNSGHSATALFNVASDPLRLVTSELTIGGVDYPMDEYPSQSGSVEWWDAFDPLDADLIFVRQSSSQRPAGSGSLADGQYMFRSLVLRWMDPNDPGGLVDLNTSFDPLSWVSTLNALPFYAYYTTGINNCVGGVCATTQSFTNFEVSSFLVHTPSVPEPGTLGLFAAGLLGAGLVRRRRQH